MLAGLVPTSTHTKSSPSYPHRRPVGTDHVFKPGEPAQGYSIDMFDQGRPKYVDVSTHARDAQKNHEAEKRVQPGEPAQGYSINMYDQ